MATRKLPFQTCETSLKTPLEQHEEICDYRWDAINARMKRMENIMITCAGTGLVGMAGIIVTLLSRLPK